MAEIQHPFIDTSLQEPENMSLAQEFAEQAFEVLGRYRRGVASFYDDSEVVLPITDHVEIISDDPTIVTALRLRRVLSLAMTSAATAGTDRGVISDDFLVLTLEYGTVPPDELVDMEDEDIDPQDFVWQPYAVAITSTTLQENIDGVSYYPRETEVVNGDTGAEFTEVDIMQAMHALEVLRRGLLGQRYDELLSGEALDIEPTINTCASTNATECITDKESASALSESNYDHHACDYYDCTIPPEQHQRSMYN